MRILKNIFLGFPLIIPPLGSVPFDFDNVAINSYIQKYRQNLTKWDRRYEEHSNKKSVIIPDPLLFYMLYSALIVLIKKLVA